MNKYLCFRGNYDSPRPASKVVLAHKKDDAAIEFIRWYTKNFPSVSVPRKLTITVLPLDNMGAPVGNPFNVKILKSDWSVVKNP